MKKRNLYLKTTPVKEAKEKYIGVLNDTIQPKKENVNVSDAHERITTDPIFAKNNSPLTDSAAMDGIAVISKDTAGADISNPRRLTVGEDCIVVDTGDPITPPWDSVIMAEDITVLEDEVIEIRAAASPWQHVRPVGEDIVSGEMILPGNHEIRSIDIGVLLAGGITELEVYKKPSVAIIPTGTEIVKSGSSPKQGDIIDSNSGMIAAMCEKRGCIPIKYDPIPDKYELLKKTIQKAADENDMVAVIAGSSAGTEDYTVHILRELGEVIVHGVAMKPGKPVILAKINGKPVIGVPGYPVSAYLAFDIFASGVLELMTRKKAEKAEETNAVITKRLVSSLKHEEYVRVKMGLVDDKLIATPLARGAGAAMSLVRADGFCIIPQNSEGIEGGEQAKIKLLKNLPELYSTIIAIGSHDLILDIIDDIMQREKRDVSLSSTHVGSMGGLMALTRNECHIAPTHILDEDSGEYNVNILKELFGSDSVSLIKGVGRTQGIMVLKDNPLEIKEIKDLVQHRFINRQRGSGTRILLDYTLKNLGINPEDINGYDREAATHMAVAAAVKNGSADAGIGVYSAAKAMGLNFIPIADEHYDFAVRTKNIDKPHIKTFIDILKSEELKLKLDNLGGYTTENRGEIISI